MENLELWITIIALIAIIAIFVFLLFRKQEVCPFCLITRLSRKEKDQVHWYPSCCLLQWGSVRYPYPEVPRVRVRGCRVFCECGRVFDLRNRDARGADLGDHIARHIRVLEIKREGMEHKQLGYAHRGEFIRRGYAVDIPPDWMKMFYCETNAIMIELSSLMNELLPKLPAPTNDVVVSILHCAINERAERLNELLRALKIDDPVFVEGSSLSQQVTELDHAINEQD